MLELSPQKYTELLYSQPVLLLSSRVGLKANVMPVCWYVPLSSMPALIGVSLTPSSYTCHLVQESGEFVLGVPDETMLKEIHFCGVHCGMDVDKIRHLKLVTHRARDVSAFLISDCLGQIECRVRQVQSTGDRKFFISEVMTVTVQPFAWNNGWTDEIRLVHYLGGLDYRIGNEVVRVEGVHPGYVPPER